MFIFDTLGVLSEHLIFNSVYIVAKNRDCDMTTFFKHENQPFPPSLSEHGKLRFSKKSDLMSLLPVGDQCDPPNFFDAIAIDGAALVHLQVSLHLMSMLILSFCLI